MMSFGNALAEEHERYQGVYVELSDGSTHFRWDGPENGEPMLLIHGATVPMWQFNRIVPYFNAANYRTLRFDLFGHGRSDCPPTAYTLEFLVKQVFELLESQSVREPLHVLGHSLGAAIATRLTTLAPEKVASLTLVAPMLDFTAVNKQSGLLQYPLLGEMLMRFYITPMLIRRRRRRYKPIAAEELAELFNEQVRRSGFRHALLSLFRCGTLASQHATYQALRQLRLSQPMLILRGSQDDVAIAGHVSEICDILNNAHFQELKDMQHSLMISHPQQVADVIMRFLRKPGSFKEEIK